MNKNKHSAHNIFTNSCIRTIANTGILQPYNIAILGEAISQLLHQEFDEPCAILIATDTRISSPWIKDALLKGLGTYDHDIYDAGICPTPFVAKALKEYQPDGDDHESFDIKDIEEPGFFTLGIIITASHNPAEYNGIKILTEFGYLTTEIEQEISNIYHELMFEAIDTQNNDLPECIDIDLVDFYETAIAQQLDNVPFKNLSVTLDCANGAAALIAPHIFHSCGIQTKAINNTQNGALINEQSGCHDPKLLLEAIRKHGTTWGCAFDGDGDRLIIVHQSGRIFDGDDILLIIAQHQGYQEFPTLVGTIMTNQAIVQHLQMQQKRLLRTNVGERNIIEALIQNESMLGAETCGHITMMDHAFCSDGIFASLLFFDTITEQPELLDLQYQKYPQVQINIPLKNKTIDKKTIDTVISKYQKHNARIVVRASNTEPVLRIMVEHQNANDAQNIAQQLEQAFIALIK